MKTIRGDESGFGPRGRDMFSGPTARADRQGEKKKKSEVVVSKLAEKEKNICNIVGPWPLPGSPPHSPFVGTENDITITES